MSETDKYEAAAQHIEREASDGYDDTYNATEAAAYLREHFVTREEYEAGTSARIAQVEAITAERDRLRAALVEAAIPLEAMLISGATQGLWQGLQQGIEHGAECCRQALNQEDV